MCGVLYHTRWISIILTGAENYTSSLVSEKIARTLVLLCIVVELASADFELASRTFVLFPVGLDPAFKAVVESLLEEESGLGDCQEGKKNEGHSLHL